MNSEVQYMREGRLYFGMPILSGADEAVAKIHIGVILKPHQKLTVLVGGDWRRLEIDYDMRTGLYFFPEYPLLSANGALVRLFAEF